MWQVCRYPAVIQPRQPHCHTRAPESCSGGDKDPGGGGGGAAEIYTLSILNLGPVVLGPLRVDTFMRYLMQKLLHVYFGLHGHCLRGIGGFRGL